MEKLWDVRILKVTRPAFLVLVPACVLPGIATASMATGSLRWMDVLIVFIGALMAHISVNVLNEYQDFRSGLDYMTQKTPFSGGSGTLPAHPECAPAALTLGIAALVISGLAGIYFSIVTGWLVWVPAFIGALTIIFYTGLINRFAFLCLIAPGIGFGSCMVIGTHYALSGTFTQAGITASLVPFFLVSNLLLLNQFPDVEADRKVGRCHYPLLIGRMASAKIYAAFLTAAFGVIVTAVWSGIFPRGALLGLLPVIPAIPMVAGIFKYADRIDRLQPFMGMNIMITLLTPILMASGILFF